MFALIMNLTKAHSVYLSPTEAREHFSKGTKYTNSAWL